MRKFIAVAFALLLTVASVHAQQGGQNGLTSPPTLRQALLNPNGFNVDWSCRSSTGRSFVTFREESGKIIVDINNFARGSCKSEAKLTDSGAIWDGCREAGIAMSFDANNKEIPFKGQGPSCSYEFKAK
jgi:hypothetical protein